ncbi:transglutaminase family protein [Leptospira sp. WS92.C1]
MSQKIPFYIFFILSFCLNTILFADSAYPELVWEKVESEDYPQLVLPAPGEQVRTFQGALIAGNWLLWPAILPGESEKESHGILLRNLKDGSAKRLDLKEPVRGLAWDREKNLIYARLKKEIVVIENGSFEIQRRFPFVNTGSGWTSIGVFQEKLYSIQGNTFSFYDLENGVEIESKILPIAKVSQSYACSDKEIFFWYTEGDKNLHSYNPLLNTIKDHFGVRIDSKLAPKLACRTGGFAVLDPEKGIFKNLVRIGDQFYLTSKENQILKGNLSYRFSPQRDKIQYTLSVTAKEKDSPESEIAVAIPPKETAYQVLTDESVFNDGSFKEDQQNNRTLFVKVPALSSGQTWTQTVYSAKLTRYNLDSGLSNFQTSWEDWKVPGKWKQFLEDNSVYKIQDPSIVSLRDQLRSESGSVEGYIRNVYKYITKNMVYKQDGKFDDAPVVLKNGHGSCTEHSYAQIALLRSAGIPARLVWNWLPGATNVSFNHKIAEVWHPSFGWIPMEPLAYPRARAGLTHAKHIIFAVLNSPFHSIIKGGDVLHSFTKAAGGASRSLSIELTPEVSVTSREIVEQDSSFKELYEKAKEIRNKVIDKDDGRSVE